MAPASIDRARAATLFHALSDETRLEIIDMLSGQERCVCELTDALDAAQSRLSFHLRVLREAGLVTDRREGRWIYYALAPQAFGEAAELLQVHLPRRRALPIATGRVVSRSSPRGAASRSLSCCD